MKETGALFSLLLVLSGCGVPHSAPKLMDADGTSYAACRDLIWVNEKSGLLGGETTYDITFTDADGVGHDIRGIKHLTMTDIPETIPYALPYPLPDVKTGNSGGPYPEGSTWNFSNGSKAVIKNGEWTPLKHENTICQPPQQ
jgi:hypothetical protein